MAHIFMHSVTLVEDTSEVVLSNLNTTYTFFLKVFNYMAPSYIKI